MVINRWEKLEHAYGTASDIPVLLDRIALFPPEISYADDPWHSLWSALYHQGDIYSASLAVVPEIAAILTRAPERVTPSFFSLPASIEVARNKSGMAVPQSLNQKYHSALTQLATFASGAIGLNHDPKLRRAALTILAVASGQHAYAELILEVPIDEVGEVLEWYQER
ncbi:MAG: hypothetical protein JXA73_01115 [Acidobacteria bacterium]|nr:hypothetical protein [Acidobacteriota bacterium]